MEKEVTDVVGFHAEKQSAQDVLDSTFDVSVFKDPFLHKLMHCVRTLEVVKKMEGLKE